MAIYKNILLLLKNILKHCLNPSIVRVFIKLTFIQISIIINFVSYKKLHFKYKHLFQSKYFIGQSSAFRYSD